MLRVLLLLRCSAAVGAGTVYSDAACVVDVCCCLGVGAVYADAPCTVDLCCCFKCLCCVR